MGTVMAFRINSKLAVIFLVSIPVIATGISEHEDVDNSFDPAPAKIMDFPNKSQTQPSSGVITSQPSRGTRNRVQKVNSNNDLQGSLLNPQPPTVNSPNSHHNSSSAWVNPNSDLPAYVRKKKGNGQTMHPHNPGKDDFIYDEDEFEITGDDGEDIFCYIILLIHHKLQILSNFKKYTPAPSASYRKG